MSRHVGDRVEVNSEPAASGAAAASVWGEGFALTPEAFNAPVTGLTMLGSPDGGDACADGSCAIAIDPAG